MYKIVFSSRNQAWERDERIQMACKKNNQKTESNNNGHNKEKESKRTGPRGWYVIITKVLKSQMFEKALSLAWVYTS